MLWVGCGVGRRIALILMPATKRKKVENRFLTSITNEKKSSRMNLFFAVHLCLSSRLNNVSRSIKIKMLREVVFGF